MQISRNKLIVIIAALPLLVGLYSFLFHTSEYAPFFLLGLLGAIFANSTGAGGGVIFIPAFQQLGIVEAQSVATSFAIQCFGMTMGSVAWIRHSRKCEYPDWQLLSKLVKICLPFSVAGIWLIYGLELSSPASLSHLFAYFSIVIGIGLLLTNLLTKPVSEDVCHTQVKMEIVTLDVIGLALISFIGGVVTAWLSVGVGEFIAFYLILRGYRVTMAIATAVIVSAASVWSGIGYHIEQGNVYWDILVFAGPAALVGAVLARRLATWLPVVQLKLFFASWVLFAGVFELLT